MDASRSSLPLQATLECIARSRRREGESTLDLTDVTPGDDDDVTLDLRDLYTKVLVGVFVDGPGGASAAEDLREAVTILEDIERRSRRVFGADHPNTLNYEASLEVAHEMLALSEKCLSR